MLKIFYFILFLKLLNCVCDCDQNDINCKYSNDLNFVSQECPYGLTKLECNLNYTSLDSSLVSNLGCDCYSHLRFVNVYKIKKHAFRNLKLKNNNSTQVIFSFENVFEIDSYAFGYLKSPYQLVDIYFNNFYQKNTLLNDKCFSLMQNVNLIEFSQYKDLKIPPNSFDQSNINTLSIQKTIFNRFYLNNSQNFLIKNLFINDSFVHLLTSDFFSNYYKYESISIINSALDSLPNFLDKFESLKRLDLSFNSIKEINLTLNELIELNVEANPIKILELHCPKLEKLTLKRTLIEHLNVQAINLKELDLSHSYMIKKYQNLNSLLDQMEKFDINNLKFIDLSYDQIGLDENFFMLSFSKQKNCLWKKFQYIFVKVDKSHECTCSLFYLYRGFNLSTTHLDHVPKCLARIVLEQRLDEYEKKCDFYEKVSECSQPKSTTTTAIITSPTTIKFETTQIEELFIRKKIVSHYTIPVILSSFVLCVLLIVFFVLKARNDYKNKFMKVYKNNIIDDLFEHKEMQQIVSVSSKSFAVRLNDSFNSDYNI